MVRLYYFYDFELIFYRFLLMFYYTIMIQSTIYFIYLLFIVPLYLLSIPNFHV